MIFSFVIELYSVFANPEEWQYRKKLRLGELPVLPVIDIVRSMSLKDQIQLALSSKKYEAVCSIARVNVKWISFHVQDEYTGLDLGKSTTLCCGNKEHINEKDKISHQKLSKWLVAGSSATPLQRLACLSEEINKIFKSDDHHLFIYMDEMKNASVKDIMDVPMFKNCEKITLVRGEIESDDLRLVLDMAKHLKYFRLGTKVLSDFQHEKAFSIERIIYEDANWVRLENLLAMRNSTEVTLGMNSLTYSDFNRFLKFWVNSEVDMFIDLYIKKEENINPEILFDGLIFLNLLRFSHNPYLIVANSTLENRKRPCLYVDYLEEQIRFIALSQTGVWFRLNEDRSSSTEKKTFQSEFDALRILEKQAELRKKMEGMEVPDEDDMQRMKELDMKLNGLLAEGKFIVGE